MACDPDDVIAPMVVEQVGDECVVWASDYPHPDAQFPGALDVTLRSLAGLSESSRARLLGSNGQRLFGLPS